MEAGDIIISILMSLTSLLLILIGLSALIRTAIIGLFFELINQNILMRVMGSMLILLGIFVFIALIKSVKNEK